MAEKFDLTTLRTRQWRQDRRLFAMLIFGDLFIIAWMAGLGGIAVPTVRRDGWLSSVGLTIALTEAAAIGLAIYGLGISRMRLPGALEAKVDPAGFTLRYSAARSNRFGWSDPKLRIVLEDMSVDPNRPAADPKFAVRLGTSSMSRRSVLSREAFDAILSSACSASVQITWRRGGVRSLGPVETYHVLGRAAS